MWSFEVHRGRWDVIQQTFTWVLTLPTQVTRLRTESSPHTAPGRRAVCGEEEKKKNQSFVVFVQLFKTSCFRKNVNEASKTRVCVSVCVCAAVKELRCSRVCWGEGAEGKNILSRLKWIVSKSWHVYMYMSASKSECIHKTLKLISKVLIHNSTFYCLDGGFIDFTYGMWS